MDAFEGRAKRKTITQIMMLKLIDIAQKDVKQIPAKLLSNYNEWEYDKALCDWVNVITGEKLSGYKLPSHLK